MVVNLIDENFNIHEKCRAFFLWLPREYRARRSLNYSFHHRENARTLFRACSTLNALKVYARAREQDRFY